MTYDSRYAQALAARIIERRAAIMNDMASGRWLSPDQTTSNLAIRTAQAIGRLAELEYVRVQLEVIEQELSQKPRST